MENFLKNYQNIFKYKEFIRKDERLFNDKTNFNFNSIAINGKDYISFLKEHNISNYNIIDYQCNLENNIITIFGYINIGKEELNFAETILINKDKKNFFTIKASMMKIISKSFFHQTPIYIE